MCIIWLPNARIAYKHATVEWVDGNFGSKVTMKYPCDYFKRRGCKRLKLFLLQWRVKVSIKILAAKLFIWRRIPVQHIVSKSISKEGGRSSYRGLLKVIKGAHTCQCTCAMRCSYCLMTHSRSDTYPTLDSRIIRWPILGMKLSVSKISDEQIFYLMSRGLTEAACACIDCEWFY